jgi:hypothetical protein
MPPAKFKPKRDKSNAAKTAAALARLKARWEVDHEDEDWEPEKEPIITPMLKGVEGGIAHVLEALRAHDDDDAHAFISVYDELTASDRKVLGVESVAFAAGLSSLRLAEVAQTALFLHGQMKTKMLLSSAMPKVMRSTIKAATDEVPITAYDFDLGANTVVGKTNGDIRAMEMFHKMSGMMPIPKGSQIAIQVNAAEKEPKTIEAGHTWKYPEERLKEIVGITNPKQLDAPRTVASDHIHFDANRPMVFER